MEVRIGTSGWHYAHWRGPFYPERFPAAKMLEFYAERFDTVELNNTFYRLPPEGAAAEWKRGAPPGFLFAAKGSRFLTHMKKLRDDGSGIENFFSRVEGLGRKLGPVVFQLPPRWRVNTERLEAFLDMLPKRRRYAFEFREPSWHTPEVYRILRRRNAAFCIFEIGGWKPEHEITADFTYIRLHGPGGPYQGSYSRAELKKWALRIRQWSRELKAAYVYFDNDQAGYAAKNALELKSYCPLPSR
ncbi:MAG TPA: DUF72 domain-containing protein [Candidatus Solibacter sp.]|nr:DUF72 domain-containing protein [Candidatus Solibacter sp.]